MNTSPLTRAVANPILFLLEYLFKFAAGVIAVIVLAAQGTFLAKLGAGFGSLLQVLRRIAAWPEQLGYLGRVIDDYNAMTAADFNQRYGGQAINRVMDSLNEAVTYGQEVYRNVAEQPVATLAATLVAFLVFYVTARTFRFVRQRGQGSYLTRKERELGNRVFRRER